MTHGNIVGSVYERISAIKNTATQMEKKLIEELDKIDNNSIIYCSITELSEITSVAEATIVRFCKKLGFKGFQDFKLTLSQDMAIQKDIDGEDKPKIIAKLMQDAIERTCDSVDYEYYKELASKIISARKVCVGAVGTSTIVANALKIRLSKYGIMVDNSNDPHIQSIYVANMNSDDVLILISVSGSTMDIINLAEIANLNNVPTIVITNHLKSPLTKNATYICYNCIKELPYDGGSLITVVSQHYTVDMLCTAVYEQLGEKAKQSANKAVHFVSGKLV